MAQDLEQIRERMSKKATPKRPWLAFVGGIVALGFVVGVVAISQMSLSQAGVNPSGIGSFVQWPARAKSGGSTAFWKHWGDGKAELSSYNAVIDRYGEKRKAELVLIYVTEPMNRQNWIKDDAASKALRVPVLKLNHSLKFKTGLYPYSVLTSTFSPVSKWRTAPFAPAKVTISIQEWCGHVFAGIWAGNGRFQHQIMSYFASEGERKEQVKAPADVLYEDALLIQMRELDGAFAGGKKAWSGQIVPSLWRTRKLHRPLRPLAATIQRSAAKFKGKDVKRFVLRYTSDRFSQTYHVEKAWPHRVLGWSNSDGEKVSLHKSKRLPYWSLNSNASRHYRGQLGLK